MLTCMATVYKPQESTTTQSTTTQSTTAQSTTARSTTARSTTARSTAARSTAARSTAARSTAARSTAARSTTARSTAARSTTSQSTAARSTTARSTTARSTTARSTTARSTAARSTTTWSTTSQQRVAPSQQGTVFNACEVLSLGLLFLNFKDAIREGDGDRVLKWSRFVNMKGLSGHNISCDLHNEHLNQLLKVAIEGPTNPNVPLLGQERLLASSAVQQSHMTRRWA